MLLMRACASALRMILPWSMPGSSKSTGYLMVPQTFSLASLTGIALPTTVYPWLAVTVPSHQIGGVQH